MNIKTTHSINFLRGVPSEEALSHIIPMVSEGYEKVIRQYGTEVLQYGHFSGFKPLRELIANMHRVDPDRVFVGNGGLEVISLFFKSLPLHSNIIVEETSYDRVLLDAKRYGHHLIGVKLTPEGVDLDQFQEVVNEIDAAAFYGIPFHHNPTGINYTKENRKAVESVCNQRNIFCVWDICYRVLRYDGKVNEAIEVSDWGPILTSSFTKTITPGTKCGYIIVPNHFIEHLTGIAANTRINPNLPTHAFIADFIQSGRYDDYLKYLCDLYKPKMDALNTAINAYFPGVFPTEISGGFFAPLTFLGISEENESTFIKAAKDAGVGIAPAWNAVAPNFTEDYRKNALFVRLTYPAFPVNDIEWGISKLKEVSELFN